MFIYALRTAVEKEQEFKRIYQYDNRGIEIEMEKEQHFGRAEKSVPKNYL